MIQMSRLSFCFVTHPAGSLYNALKGLFVVPSFFGVKNRVLEPFWAFNFVIYILIPRWLHFVNCENKNALIGKR